MSLSCQSHNKRGQGHIVEFVFYSRFSYEEQNCISK